MLPCLLTHSHTRASARIVRTSVVARRSVARSAAARRRGRCHRTATLERGRRAQGRVGRTRARIEARSAGWRARISQSFFSKQHALAPHMKISVFVCMKTEGCFISAHLYFIRIYHSLIRHIGAITSAAEADWRAAAAAWVAQRVRYSQRGVSGMHYCTWSCIIEVNRPGQMTSSCEFSIAFLGHQTANIRRIVCLVSCLDSLCSACLTVIISLIPTPTPSAQQRGGVGGGGAAVRPRGQAAGARAR